MFNEINLYCKIYIQTDISLQELAELTAQQFGGRVEMYSVFTPLFEIDIEDNEEFNEVMNRDFPDGFLYFRYYLDIVPLSKKLQKAQVELISSFLETLWEKGMSAVAACDYEDLLPKMGGYKSNTIPWPGST